MSRLKLDAWFYRLTGIQTKYAKRLESEYLNSIGDVSELALDIATGCWQARNGFYRSWEQIERHERLRKFFNRLKRFKS